MRTRPVLHETENEAEAKMYEVEATKFGFEAGLNIPGINSFAQESTYSVCRV